MTREIHLSTPLRIKDIDQLVIGDKVFIRKYIKHHREHEKSPKQLKLF